jgi:diguanylate cyclase (GGDEF)-like protein
LERFLNNPEIIRHYDLLQSLGVLDEISECSRRVRNLEEVISDAIEIFNRQSLEELVEYITANLVDRFVPEYMQFVFRTGGHEKELRNICFKNLKPARSPAPINDLQPFERFFHRYPGTISFSLFEYSIEDPEIAGRLTPLKPEIIVPVAGPDELYGIIIVGAKIVEGEYTREEIVYIDRLMKFASLSMQNTIHYTSSVTDYKTGLYNHSFFLKRLQEELAKVSRYGRSISLLVIDIDYFKPLNDRHGHLAGDKVLYELARCFEETLRTEDVIARFGGEEFTVLLPVSTAATALQVAERLRHAVEELRIAYGDTQLRITVSIGVEQIDAHHSIGSPQFHIDRADRALYKAKEEGRNRVRLHRTGLLYRAIAAHTPGAPRR